MLKSHDSPTASLAWAVQRDVGDAISVFGGICCDREVGGVNPAAVEVALGLGARIVWLPTLSSRQDFDNGVAAQLGIPGPGHRRRPTPTTSCSPRRRRCSRSCSEHDAILATGHVSAAEHYAVVKDVRARRARCVLTHATEDLAGPKLTAAQCRELAELGAWVELCAMTCIGGLATRPSAEMVETIRAVGVERVTLGTDFGQKINPHPAAGLQTYADALFAEGLTEAEIRRMACTNPTALLGLDTGSVVVPRIEVPEGKADPEVRVWALRPEMGMGAGALSHAIYEQSIVPVRERELARMRIAQINDCVICQQWRSTPGRRRRSPKTTTRNVARVAHVRRLLRARAARDRVRGAVRARPPQHRRRRSTRGCAPSTPTPRSSTSPCASAVARARSHAARARPRRTAVHRESGAVAGRR